MSQQNKNTNCSTELTADDVIVNMAAVPEAAVVETAAAVTVAVDMLELGVRSYNNSIIIICILKHFNNKMRYLANIALAFCLMRVRLRRPYMVDITSFRGRAATFFDLQCIYY